MTFQEYLEEKFSEELEIGGVPITKDNYESMSDNYMSDLDVQEVIDLAEEWGKTLTEHQVKQDVELPDYMKLPPFPTIEKIMPSVTELLK